MDCSLLRSSVLYPVTPLQEGLCAFLPWRACATNKNYKYKDNKKQIAHPEEKELSASIMWCLHVKAFSRRRLGEAKIIICIDNAPILHIIYTRCVSTSYQLVLDIDSPGRTCRATGG